MGDRYYMVIKCPKCGYVEHDVYYAPTCGITKWKCPECEKIVDLGKHSGISYEDASNLEEIEEIIGKVKK